MILLLSSHYPDDQIMKEKGGACGTYEGRGEIHKRFCWEHLKKRDIFKQLMLNGRITLTIFKKYVWKAWIGFICLNVATCGGGLLNTV
jgi:hypothetical protein